MFRKEIIICLLLLNFYALDQFLAERIDDLICKRLQINQKSNSAQCMLQPEERRVDCYPEALQTGRSDNEQACLDRKCCWREAHGPSNYQAYQLIKNDENEYGIYMEFNRHTPIPYRNLFGKISVEINYLNENSLRIRFNTSEQRLFEPPIKLDLPKFNKTKAKQYDVHFLNNIITVLRTSTKALIWSADLNTLVMSEQFNQLFTSINSNVVRGLGEHHDVYEKQVKDRKQMLFFNKDQVPRYNADGYGHHPFYLNYEMNEGTFVNAHSVLLMNTNIMELIMMNKPALLWRTLGGSFQFYINLGPSPLEAIQQHVQIVGLQKLVPYFSLGFHLCRFGYNHIDKAKDVTQRTLDAKIPYDTMWLDIDFMEDRTMFKINHNTFPNLKEWILELKSKNIHFIPIIDPGLSDAYPENEYPYYHEGLRKGLYIMNNTNEVLRSKVWSKGYNAWVDFSNPKVNEFWTKTLKTWYVLGMSTL